MRIDLKNSNYFRNKMTWGDLIEVFKIFKGLDNVEHQNFLNQVAHRLEVIR
jgi:hypothetical protein